MRFTVYRPLYGNAKIADVKVTEFTEAEKYSYKRHRYEVGKFTLVVPATANGINRVLPDMLIYVEDPDTVNDSLIITAVENDDYHYTITGTDMKGMLTYRVTMFPQEEIEAGTYGYDVRQGETSDIIHGYVDYNCINPTDPNRKIIGLVCDESGGGIADDTYMSRLQPLNEVVEALCKNADIGYDIKMFLPGYEDNYALEILPGEDRTNDTGGNRKCIFADFLQNTETITGMYDTAGRRTCVWTVNGSDVDGAIVTSVYKSDDAGFMRREAVMTANCDLDLIEKYVSSQTGEMVDKETLKFTLADHTVYGKEFNVGDKVSAIKNSEMLDKRVLSANKEYSAGSMKVNVEIGDIPEKKLLNKTGANLSQRADDVKELALENAKLKKEVESSTGGVGEFLDEAHTAERFNDYTLNSSVMKYDHIEGQNNKVLNSYGSGFRYSGFNHVEGQGNTLNGTSGDCTHIEGSGNTYTGTGNGYNHVEGYGNTLTGGMQNHVGGLRNTVTGSSRMWVSGQQNSVSGCSDSVVNGASNNVQNVQESAVFGHGHSVRGQQGSPIVHAAVFGTNHIYEGGEKTAAIFGNYGKVDTLGQIFVIGSGSLGNNENCFEVRGSQGVFATGGYNTLGADYAEYFEWADGNTDCEDRCGMLVTLDGDKLIPAHGDDILGAVSAAPSVSGNAYETFWHGKYERDVFGRVKRDDAGKPVISASFDPDAEYIPRSQRPEWAAVGLTGRLVIRDDGSCKVGGFVSARRGVGTSCYKNTGVRVLRRIDERHAEVLIK